MQDKGKQKRGHRITTITPLLRHFIGLELGVELKNGRSYYGYLNDSDDDMNLTLSSTRNDENDVSTEVVCGTHEKYRTEVYEEQPTCHTYNRVGEEENDHQQDDLGIFQFSKLQIRGSTIRFIHFPDNADLPALIRVGMDRKRAAQDKYARGKRQKR